MHKAKKPDEDVTVRGPRGYFGMLAVDPKQQGTGPGRTMVTAAEDYFREHGCDSIEIDVLSLRPDLLLFYCRLGYSEIGTHPAPLVRALKPGLECHAIIVSKTL